MFIRRTTRAVSRPAEEPRQVHLTPVPQRKDALPALASLEDVLDSATAVPFTNRILVDADYFADALEQLHSELPTAIARAESIIRDEQAIRERAEAEARRIVARAESQITAMLSEKGLLKEAEATRERILRDTRAEAQEIRDSARKYVDDLLGKLERSAADVLAEVRKATTTVRTHS